MNLTWQPSGVGIRLHQRDENGFSFESIDLSDEDMIEAVKAFKHVLGSEKILDVLFPPVPLHGSICSCCPEPIGINITISDPLSGQNCNWYFGAPAPTTQPDPHPEGCDCKACNEVRFSKNSAEGTKEQATTDKKEETWRDRSPLL